MKKKLLWSAVIVASTLFAVMIGSGFYMLDYALSNADRSKKKSYAYVMKNYPETLPWLDSLRHNGILRDTFIVMPDGERAHAIFARSDSARGRTAVVVHGYKDRSTGMLHIAYIYNKVMGYNILLPDLHGHGLSDGDDIQMGWKDRLDVMRWMAVADSLWGGTEGTAMVLHGISMGAATVMCVSGERLPNYVKCFVEDCGYTSVWDEFEHELASQFHLPAFPLLYTTSLQCKLRYGWSFGEASPLHQVARCHKPMLFIHGDRDTYVPFAMMQRLYDAKPEPKQMWIARGSIHAMSFRDHPQEYARRVRLFVDQYIR